ncbi:MAG TPA: transglutaminase family protein [Streptosporangiaceae bacterium]|jgi:transglutaminase-like putative cysteine protease
MMLSSELLSAPLLDHRGLDLEAASRVTYVLQQSFRYDYERPVQALRQRLVIVPRSRHGNQYRRAHNLEVDGAQAERRVRRDSRGNVVTALLAEHVASSVEFRLAAILERIRDHGPIVVPRAVLDSPGLLRPTRLTAADDRLRELARGLTVSSDTPLERAERICAGVHAAMSYRDGVTSVQTPAAAALASGYGVCQDYAHIMLAVCHLAGLPARYVSGHLLGQGGTHAWVEVLVPSGRDAMAAALDPCNGCRAGSGYLTVATGRDYSDVAPTSGSYEGTSRSRLTAARRVGVLAAA